MAVPIPLETPNLSQSTLFMEEVELEDDLVIMDNSDALDMSDNGGMSTKIDYAQLKLDDIDETNDITEAGVVDKAGWLSTLWGAVLSGLCMAEPK